MDEANRLAVFKAQTKNVQRLVQVRRHLQRSINRALLFNDAVAAEVHTHCLALVFCAWVEATLSKLIHTPHGFALAEIEQITSDGRASRSVAESWKQAIQLGLRRVPGQKGELQNRQQEILRLVETHVVEPSILRNKIAHGQWAVALNRGNTAINADLTAIISTIDVVKLDLWFETQKHLISILSAIIASPERTFRRDYWVHVTNLKEYIRKTSHYSLADKTTQLKTKYANRKLGVSLCQRCGSATV